MKKRFTASLPSVLAATALLMACGTEPAKAEMRPYVGEPPRIVLTDAADIQKLENFEPVYPPVVDDGNAGGAQAVFRVKGPAKMVWDVIADFPNYTKYNSDVSESSYYKAKQGDNIFVKFKAGPWLYPVTWYVKHNYPMLKKGWGTWELDKTQDNRDLKECIGFWRVDPVAGNPNYSDVSYSVNLEGSGFVLNLLRSMLVSSGVKKATQWVKAEVERRSGL
jgi:hypothetical protein